MEDLKTQLAMLLGGTAVFDASSPFDVGALASFLNAQAPNDAFFSSPSLEQTSPLLSGSMSLTDEQSLEALFTPMLSSSNDELSLDAILTPGLSSNSLAPSPDLTFSSSLSPATGMLDLFPTARPDSSPTLQLAQSLLGGSMAVSGSMFAQAEAAAHAQALAAAVTAQIFANTTQTPALPPPPSVTGPQSGDVDLAVMLLNKVGEKGTALPTAPVISFPLPNPEPASDAPPVIDPVTGLPIKVKKKVGRKKKPRPTDPEVIAAELARKRSKNTEAARRSRIKRMQKVDSLEERLRMLEEERDEFEKRITELEEINAMLEARVGELEPGEMSE